MNDEAWEEQQELSEQAQQSEYELYEAIFEAIEEAKKLGLSEDHLKTLCWVAGVDYSNLEN